MKTKLFSIFLMFILCSSVFLPISIAQDYTTFSLPEGATKRLGKGTITGEVKYSPDGTQLAVASSIGIWIYDAQTGEELDLFTGWVESVLFSPDGQTLASEGGGDTISIWDVETGAVIHTLSGDRFAFSPDGSKIVSGSDDDTIHIWNVETGDVIHTLSGSSFAFSPNGNTIASGSGKGTFHIWNVETGDIIHTLSGSGFRFNPDGSKIASGSGDDTISIWDIETGAVIHTLSGGAFVFSPDGTTIATWSDGNMLHIWDVETGDVIYTISVITDFGINRVVFSPDGSIFASWDDANSIDIRNAETGAIIQTFYADVVFSGSHSYVVFSPDGSTFVSWDDYDTLQIWDAETGDVIRTLGHEISYSVMFNPDGRLLAFGLSGPFTISIWDADTGDVIQTFDGDGFELSPDGSTIATWNSEDELGGDGIPISIHDVETGDVIHTLSGAYSIASNPFALSPDGTTLASWVDGTIRLWNTNTGTHIRTLTGHTGSVNNVAFSPDGTTLASGSDNDTISIWNIETGAVIHMLSGSAFAFSPDGTTLASWSDDTIRLWNTNTGANIGTLIGHTGSVNSVAFSPDGTTLASGSKDGTISIWDVETGDIIHTLSGGDFAFSPDGSTIATSSSGGTVLLWDLIRIAGGTQSIEDKDIVVKFQIEKNGKEVTIYQEDEDMLVYTFGVPGEPPELEYKGQILATVYATAVLWGEGVESLMDISNSTWVDELNSETEVIIQAANSRESRGFVRVFASTGLVSQSVYIFRTGGWEYTVSFTGGRPINIPKDELDDYQSYGLTVVSPGGKMYRLR